MAMLDNQGLNSAKKEDLPKSSAIRPLIDNTMAAMAPAFDCHSERQTTSLQRSTHPLERPAEEQIPTSQRLGEARVDLGLANRLVTRDQPIGILRFLPQKKSRLPV